MEKRRVYLDNNATTKMDKEAFEAMIPYFCDYYGNSSSMHSFGKETGAALKEARSEISRILEIDTNELVFTGTGVEGSNLAIRGIAKSYKNRGMHIITSEIEHPGGRNTCKDLEKEGYEVTYLPVDDNGVVKIEELKKAIKRETILITIMHANNETGVIQPVEEIGKIARENRIVFHMDAVQTVGKIEVKPKEIGCDLMTFSGHKFYGPKGIAALYVRNGVRLGRIITGGGQEKKRRPGTSNVAGAVGMAKALQISNRDLQIEMEKEIKLRDYFETQLLEILPEIVINGKDVDRLPGTTSVTFKYLEGESILLSLDYYGIAVSSGSACSSDELQASHVLLAMNIPVEFAHGTIRFSLGKENTKEDIDYVLNILPNLIGKLRTLSPLWNKFER